MRAPKGVHGVRLRVEPLSQSRLCPVTALAALERLTTIEEPGVNLSARWGATQSCVREGL
jgi:hypothetical protein